MDLETRASPPAALRAARGQARGSAAQRSRCLRRGRFSAVDRSPRRTDPRLSMVRRRSESGELYGRRLEVCTSGRADPQAGPRCCVSGICQTSPRLCTRPMPLSAARNPGAVSSGLTTREDGVEPSKAAQPRARSRLPPQSASAPRRLISRSLCRSFASEALSFLRGRGLDCRCPSPVVTHSRTSSPRMSQVKVFF